MLINILCIGDVVGKAGRNVLAEHLKPLIESKNIDFVVCNAENAAGGSGLTPTIYEKIINYGVDVVTLGDHCYRKSDIFPVLDSSDRLVRPANLPKSSAGRGSTILPTKSGNAQVAVTCVLGQVNMGNSNSPWEAVDTFLAQIPSDVISIIDMHAEVTSEKIGMGWYCNSRASIVFGTHTHVPTADCEVLDGGTAFISDVGMTGPYDSVLGRRKDRVLKFMSTGMPQKFDMADGSPRMYALLTTVDTITKKATACELIRVDGTKPHDGAYDNDDYTRTRHHNNKRR
ncbi:MAG: YmdB family metallophosphoesterase [Phycisphaerae bacterium]|nr:YmdB family metallophosphoesterase [Phycisphaerae bacterium]